MQVYLNCAVATAHLRAQETAWNADGSPDLTNGPYKFRDRCIVITNVPK